MKFVHVTTLGIVTAVVCLAFSLAPFKRTPLERRSVHQNGLDQETRFAWSEYFSLVHPDKPNADPNWLVWSDKCHAGLTHACDRNEKSTSITSHADVASAAIPRQVLTEFSKAGSTNKQNRFTMEFARAPYLATVLFDPLAAKSIQAGHLGDAGVLSGDIDALNQKQVSGADRQLPATTFQMNSEIIKLIWEVIPASPNGNVRVYDSIQPPAEDGFPQLSPVVGWRTRYGIDPDEGKPCPENLPDFVLPRNTQMPIAQVPVNSIPLNCFYHFRIQGGDTCAGQSQDVSIVWCQTDLKQQLFYAVLVGFHVMKLTERNPNWVWMTFYWTRETNEAETPDGKKWSAPWNRFHLMSTSAMREEAVDSHKICYNPYLEGPKSNGIVANCLSCHSFAAYSPTESKLGPGTEFGERYPYPLQTRKEDEKCYFVGAVQTKFVWSISTSQDANTDEILKKFQAALKQAIYQEFNTE